MRILGIDYGDARTGLSVSDPSGFLAGSPQRDPRVESPTSWSTSCSPSSRKTSIEEIVLGWPKNMDGSVRPARAEKCEALAHTLEARTGLHGRAVGRAPHHGRRPRYPAPAPAKRPKSTARTVDAVAATLILQGYLDFKRRNS